MSKRWAILFALLPTLAFAQLLPVSNVVLRGGIAPGYTELQTNGMIRWNPAVTNLQVWDGASWTNIASGVGGGGSGAGFPLTNTVSADTNAFPGRFGITNLSFVQAVSGKFDQVFLKESIYISSTGGLGELRFNGERLLINNTVLGSGFGSVNRIVAPTNAAGDLGLSLPNPSMLTLQPGTNMSMHLDHINSTNVRVRFSATSAIPGPAGAAGLGTNFFYIGNYAAGKVTAPAGPTIAAFGGEVWITTNLNYTIPENTEPASDGNKWAVWIAKGRDGDDGAPSPDLTLVTYTNGICITTNNIFSYDGSLWWPRQNLCPALPPQNLAVTNYIQIVARGQDVADTNFVFEGLTWAGVWAAQNAYPSNSVVSYASPRGIYLATQDVPSPGPWPGQSPWVLLFRDGAAGAQGAPGVNGIGNLLYDEWWNTLSTYPENTLVSFIDPYTGKKNLYRAKSFVTAGLRPHLFPSAWEEIISSGEDATILEWIWRGVFSSAFQYHNNDLVRYADKIYYSKYPTPFSGVSPVVPGAGAYWEEFVRDGTSIASNLNYRGEFGYAGVYCSGDMVSWTGSLWVVTNACVTNVAPAPATPPWLQVVAKGDTGPMGPASTNNFYFYTNILIIATQQIEYVTVTNITYGTNFVTETFTTNQFNVSNVTFTTINTQGVNRVSGFGFTNDTPTALRFETGNSFNHIIDAEFVSTIRLNTNFAASGGGGGTGTVSGTFFEIDLFGGLMPRIALVPFDEAWYYDDDGNVVPR